MTTTAAAKPSDRLIKAGAYDNLSLPAQRILAAFENTPRPGGFWEFTMDELTRLTDLGAETVKYGLRELEAKQVLAHEFLSNGSVVLHDDGDPRITFARPMPVPSGRCAADASDLLHARTPQRRQPEPATAA